MIVAGVPKCAIHPLKKASSTVLAWISTIGMASGQHVKRSTQVSKYLKPSAYGRGPTISMCTWSNLSVGLVNLPKTGRLWREILAVWQPLQERHYSAISIFIPCHTSLAFIKGFVALCDGWPNPYKFKKTFFRNFSVRYGRLCPVDTSHQIKWLSNDLSSWKFIVDDVECRNLVNSASKAWSTLNSL